MVRTSNHGGGCCGAYHLFGFTEDEERAPQSIVREFNNGVPRTRMTEVILNGRQVAAYPRVLAKLAEMGFVLDRHWINGNHNSDNYAFSRCDDRRTLELPQWPGMIASVGLHGTMPQMGAGEIPLQRHIGGEDREERVFMRDREVIREVPAPVPAPTVVATFYANHYRRTGRSSRIFASYGECVDNRAGNPVDNPAIDMLEVMSTGEHRWTENFIPF